VNYKDNDQFNLYSLINLCNRVEVGPTRKQHLPLGQHPLYMWIICECDIKKIILFRPKLYGVLGIS